MPQKILYCSDLHINRVDVRAELIAEKLNWQINKEKASIVVFAGDISDSLSETYAFLEKIKAKCIFVSGNHDRYTVDSTISPPANVVVLENSFYETDDYLFLGATLWTGLGYSTQEEDIKKKSFKRLIDCLHIKKWTAEDQLEENKKSRHFFNYFFSVRQSLRSSISYNKKINEAIAQSPVDLKEVARLLNLENDSPALDFILSAAISSLDKKIICVSHHAPFIEEFLVHQTLTKQKIDYELKNLTPRALDDCSSHDIYSMEIGRTDFEYNMLELYAYFNCEFNPKTDNNVIWVHGHTHMIKEEYPVKGVNVHCNPVPCSYYDWNNSEVNILKSLRFTPLKIDAIFKKMCEPHLDNLQELQIKIKQLKALRWTHRKTIKGIEKIVFINTLDSLRLSCKEVFEGLNSLNLVLRLMSWQGSSLEKSIRFWPRYSYNEELYEQMKEIEINIGNISLLSDAIDIAKKQEGFYFIYGGNTPSEMLASVDKFITRIKKL